MLCGERSPAISERMRCSVAGVLILVAALLTAYLLQIRSSTDWEGLAVAAIGLGSPLGYAASSIRIRAEVRNCCWILMLGYVGMVAGLALDAKGAGFDQLLALCRTGNRGSVSVLTDPFWQMPGAYVGMAFGCLAATWLLPLADSDAIRNGMRSLTKYIGMALGMAFGHWVSMTYTASLPPKWFAGTVLLSMFMGMAAGDIAVRWKEVKASDLIIRGR